MSGQKGTYFILLCNSQRLLGCPSFLVGETDTATQQLRCTGLGDSCDRCRQHDTACITEYAPRTRVRKKVVADGAAGSPNASTPREGDRTGLEPISLSTEDYDRPFRHHIHTEVTHLPHRGSHPGSPTSLPRISEIFDVVDDANRRQLERNTPTSRESSSAEGSRPPSCSCIEEALDLVQKLDDNHFRLDTLTFDHVLQVHKLLVSQCVRPLDCPRCADEAAAHTAVLLLCDRGTQMMAGLAGRPERSTTQTNSAARGVAPLGPSLASKYHFAQFSGAQPSRTFPGRAGSGSESASDDERRQFFQRWAPTADQLSDSSTGGETDLGAGSDGVFSPEFRAQFSDEELFHMIRELAWIQIRNMRRLLDRVEGMAQAKRGPTRAEKIQMLRQKMEEAAGRLDEWFDEMLVKLEP